MDIAYQNHMAEKNSRSFTDIVKTYGSQLLRFVKGRVKKTEDAEDILQEVWYQFSRLTNMDELENAGAWLYAVTRNKITDSYRKKKSESLDELIAGDEDSESTFPIRQLLLADDSNNPELKLFKDIFWDELMKALEELPEKQRRVFVLNELEEKTLQEIAVMENENLKTIISRKGYAVKHLRIRLRSLYEELKF
ncbi:RNA polymerase sigma factor sigV [Sphingobacterium multivorum]|jgi:RNA polymerase sigma factor (sigma-70 family)|nr:polymerase subunit sigma-24 [Sphingobacterium multivorum]OJZ14392.1 MAG: RNA polymerase subunit sigma-24 [Sphingobacterium sp. 40-24]HAE67427.1 RNA polymerase subunit sigma-24 [Sphingobacterium sp.]SPZ92911.1 RNA polymerase sigma factor sigV [Sphingobacterium multivorum]VXD08205.1 RNA polymerase sigma factor sigV [Sphingobacterium multivorum]